MKFSTKKAAMFGLDARIALAIFGTLSIISGAALYSTIKKIRVTQTITEMRELGKAWEAYYVDTGVNLPPNGTLVGDPYILKSINLIQNDEGVANWKGPYVSLKQDETYAYALDHPLYNHFNLLILPDDTAWGDTDAWWLVGLCTAGKKCGVWAELVYIQSLSLIKAIDEHIDNGDGPRNGKFKWLLEGASGYHVMLKIAPIPNPND